MPGIYYVLPYMPFFYVESSWSFGNDMGVGIVEFMLL